MLRIALVGYGKMGKAVEQEAVARGHMITARIDLANEIEWESVSANTTDVCIDFSHPDAFDNYLGKMLERNLRIVTGTTGWYDRMDEIRARIKSAEGSFLYASNFSVGVNLMFALNRRLAELMNPQSQYDPFVEERHHRHKADAPSGTTLKLAMDMLQGLDRKDAIAHSDLVSRPPEPNELSVAYTRAGEIIGEHRVTYTSDIDELSLSHRAFNRRGFALGSVLAAEWLIGKQGFYEMGAMFE